jgi:hypothetical protein
VVVPKERDNSIGFYAQAAAQTPGFCAYRDCFVVIPLAPHSEDDESDQTDASLAVSRRVAGAIDSLADRSFLPYQLAQFGSFLSA